MFIIFHLSLFNFFLIPTERYKCILQAENLKIEKNKYKNWDKVLTCNFGVFRREWKQK